MENEIDYIRYNYDINLREQNDEKNIKNIFEKIFLTN
jgi:hypothetical protein